jgi:uncharacterized protein involved in exopolysaccharide biosynthesis
MNATAVAPPVSTKVGEQPAPSPTLFGLTACLLAHWRLVLLGPTLIAVVATALTFLFTVRYSATSMFYPESRAPASLPAGLAGIANQFGMSLSNAAPQEGTDFYVQLLSARWLLMRLLETRFPSDSTGGDSLDLLSQLAVRGPSRAEALDKGVTRLRTLMGVTIDRRTGVASITVQAPRRDLAVDVARECLRLLDYYNLQTRRSQAKERRRFAEGRVGEVNGILTSLEDTLRRFYETNREWQTTPRLRFEEQRLNRRVQVQQQLLISLMQDLESAKMAEVNDVPVITVVDPAVPPVHKSWPRRRLIAAAAWVLSFLGLATIVIGREYRAYFVAGDPAGVAALRLQWRRFTGAWRRG